MLFKRIAAVIIWLLVTLTSAFGFLASELKTAPSDFFCETLECVEEKQPSTRNLTWENGWLHYDTASGYLVATNKIDDAGGLVIGKLDDVGKPTGWRPGDHTLNLPPLPPEPGRWAQNARELQNAIDKGRPIRDVSPTKGGGFLDRERNLLRENGWKFDPETSLWSPGG